MTLTEIIERMAAVRTELNEIAERAEPLDTDGERADELLTEWDDLEGQRAPLAARAERLEAVRAATLAAPANAERGSGPDVVVRSKRDPFDLDERAMRLGQVPASELVERARDAVEVAHRADRLDDARAEAATRLIDGKGIGRRSRLAIAEHVLRTGSDAYHDAFEQYVEDPEGSASRAAMSLTSANGGYLVPFTLDPTIVLTNAGSANPFRQIAEIKTTATNSWNGVTSAGVNAGWLAEGAEDSDHSPTFGNIAITPSKASAWVFGSYEVLEDSDFGSQFPTLLADAKDRLEEAAFATGTGSGQPYGVVTRATTVASAGAAAYAVADVYAVQQALPARFRGPLARNAWLANLAIINKTRQFDTAGGSAFWANLGMGQPERLLDAPIYESTTMVGTTTTASKNLVLGDFKQYLIVDRVGMSVMYEPIVKGANQRPTGQGGWFAFWRVGADVTTAAAFRVLTIA